MKIENIQYICNRKDSKYIESRLETMEANTPYTGWYINEQLEIVQSEDCKIFEQISFPIDGGDEGMLVRAMTIGESGEHRWWASKREVVEAAQHELIKEKQEELRKEEMRLSRILAKKADFVPQQKVYTFEIKLPNDKKKIKTEKLFSTAGRAYRYFVSHLIKEKLIESGREVRSRYDWFNEKLPREFFTDNGIKIEIIEIELDK